jgi:hypothetical protein
VQRHSRPLEIASVESRTLSPLSLRHGLRPERTRALGRTIHYVRIGDEEYRHRWVAHGLPEEEAEAWVDIGRYFRSGALTHFLARDQPPAPGRRHDERRFSMTPARGPTMNRVVSSDGTSSAGIATQSFDAPPQQGTRRLLCSAR